jgi:hypothetical protein
MRKGLLFATALAVILVGTMTAGTAPAGVVGGTATASKAGPVHDIIEIPVTMPGDFATDGVSISRGGIATGRI